MSTYITVTVTPDDGEPVQLEASARDILRWEKASNSAFVELIRRPRLVDLYKIAHYAAKREGVFEGTLTEFEAKFELRLDALDVDADPDPTPPGQ